MNTAIINLKSNLEIAGVVYTINNKLLITIENNQIVQIDVVATTQGELEVTGGSNDGGVFLRG